MKDYTPIACGDYDILELLCLDGYEIELALNNQTVRGFAQDLNIKFGAEFLMVRNLDGTVQEVRIDQIRNVIVLTRPSRFQSHSFDKSIRDQ